MSPDTRIKVVNHIYQTILAADTCGFALIEYPAQERLNWINSEKILFPKHKRYQIFNEKASWSGEFFLQLSELIFASNPIYVEDIEETCKEVKDFRKEMLRHPLTVAQYDVDKLYISKQFPNKDLGLAMILGSAVGLYAGCLDLEEYMVLLFSNSLATNFELSIKDMGTTTMIAHLVWKLISSGYYGASDFDDPLLMGHMSGGLQDYCNLLKERYIEESYLSQPYDKRYNELLSYTERHFAQASHHCFRHWTFNSTNFKKLPKHQWAEIYTGESRPYDGGFMYALLATASEHNYRLLPRALMDNPNYKSRIRELFLYL